MGRLLTLLLGLLVVAFVAYYVLEHTASESSVHSGPRQQLDQVRERSKEIERDAQRRADEAFKKSE